jgi:hypothetical protein
VLGVFLKGKEHNVRKLLFTTVTAIVIGFAGNAAHASGYCSDEFLEIQFQYRRYTNELTFAMKHKEAARELGKPLDKEVAEYARKADQLDKDVKTRAQAYVGHTECGPVDRAHIKKFTY